MPDPESFLNPCTIGTITFEKALCNLGSNINLMPLFVMRKLGIQEVHPSKIPLEMANKSLKWTYGLVENVLVKVDDIYLPVDFMILDTREDKNDSIILGRSFLATGKALIDVKRGELSHTEPPDINSKFGVGCSQLTTKKKGTKKVPKGWWNKKISTEDLSPGMRVLFTRSPVIPHTVNQILSLEHVKLIHKCTGRKFTMKSEDLSPYQPP
ncbi:uncharacterized protein LOC107489202 [Arachis duranensis]|uniref:Uncharacterized protein LOC107489202 n=1 Tax=Arachis duranensis TaxID=130453 RepID=A0A6P4DB98_ARADU|nr:uncharacterized protein LOC107489202 [Arachis duranensis]XP_025632484.1 uncharacterized protein LOC112727060 [Arachis hypogaea]